VGLHRRLRSGQGKRAGIGWEVIAIENSP
jgi:hypothetical protein